MPITPDLKILSLWAFAVCDAFVFPQSRVQPHAFLSNTFDPAVHVQQRHADTSPSSIRVKAAVTEYSSSAESRSNAKERLLRNLERRNAGEDVPFTVLDKDLALLRTPTEPCSIGTVSATAVDSWRGKWEISYAPHIEKLSKLLLTTFPTVQYVFDSDDGRMLSHARYESTVFGSGWLNADGRVFPVQSASSSRADGEMSTGVAEGDARQDVVKVVFERFWWDRNGEDRPTVSPPGATADGAAQVDGKASVVDWLVQTVGKVMFFDGLSVFPVSYLDDDFCIFEFKAAGTVVASQKVG